MGGLRTISGFIADYDVNTWQKTIPDLEARINVVKVDGVTWTEQTAPIVPGIAIPPLSENKWYLDRYNKIFYINVGNGEDANTKTIEISTYFRYWGEWAYQSEMTNNELFQIFTPQINFSLKYIKIPILQYGDPDVNEIYLQIQSLRNGLPSGKVLTQSASAALTVDWNNKQDTLYFIYFTFDEYGLRANTDYAIVLKAFGPFTVSRHLAWGRLDLIYLTGIPVDMNQITQGGNRFLAIGTKL